MKKVSKIFLGVSSFYTVICSKVFGVSGFGDITTLYGIPEPKLADKVIDDVAIFLPLILFFIGLFVLINKKISKKIKKNIILLLLIISIVVVVMSLIK